MLYFLHSTSVLSFHKDIILTLFISQQSLQLPLKIIFLKFQSNPSGANELKPLGASTLTWRGSDVYTSRLSLHAHDDHSLQPLTRHIAASRASTSTTQGITFITAISMNTCRSALIIWDRETLFLIADYDSNRFHVHWMYWWLSARLQWLWPLLTHWSYCSLALSHRYGAGPINSLRPSDAYMRQ